MKTPITLEWVQTLCRHSSPLIRCLVLVMFSTGCRFCEAHRLTWDDIDFKAPTIKIRDTKTKKTRLAHIPPPLLVALANAPKHHKPFDWSEQSLRRFWDRDVAVAAAQEPGFQRLTFHCCRHGFATDLLHKGMRRSAAGMTSVHEGLCPGDAGQDADQQAV